MENNREIMSNNFKNCAPSAQANKWNFIESKRPLRASFLFPPLQGNHYSKYCVQFIKFLCRIITYTVIPKHYIKIFKQINKFMPYIHL